MMNSLVLIGRLTERPVLEENINGKKTTTIVLAVSRNFRNNDGEYDTDFIPVSLIGQVSEVTCECCEKDDIIAIKGRLARLSQNDLQVVGDKVTFLSQKRKEDV